MICCRDERDESYAFRDDCELCAHENEPIMPGLNILICPECYNWVSSSCDLETLGIVPMVEK